MPSILIFFMGKTIALMNGISMNENLFTKSAFKIALECPNKLYYYRNPDVYANADVDTGVGRWRFPGGWTRQNLLRSASCRWTTWGRHLKQFEQTLNNNSNNFLWLSYYVVWVVVLLFLLLENCGFAWGCASAETCKNRSLTNINDALKQICKYKNENW